MHLLAHETEIFFFLSVEKLKFLKSHKKILSWDTDSLGKDQVDTFFQGF